VYVFYTYPVDVGKNRVRILPTYYYLLLVTKNSLVLQIPNGMILLI